MTKISLVLPYWDRQGVADRSIARLAELYADLDMEVVVVDDGNATPYAVPRLTPWPVRVIRLPVKNRPLNPCVPYNRGVEAAWGDCIALSGTEMLHETPVLADMQQELERGGRDTYVSAAVRAAESKRWHAHSSLRTWEKVCGVEMPKGAQFHFMTMLSRGLWNRCGGFDEGYRDGAGYDDPDLVLRLDRAGARFVTRDDLVVEHVRGGARAKWTDEMFERNRRIFVSKWGGANRAVANG